MTLLREGRGVAPVSGPGEGPGRGRPARTGVDYGARGEGVGGVTEGTRTSPLGTGTDGSTSGERVRRGGNNGGGRVEWSSHTGQR